MRLRQNPHVALRAGPVMATMETKWKLALPGNFNQLKSAGAEKQNHSLWKNVKLTKKKETKVS